MKTKKNENEEIDIVCIPPCERTAPPEEPQAMLWKDEQTVYDRLESSWSAFNSAISDDVVRTRTKKIYFPFIPGPAKDYSAIYTALMLSQGISVHAVGDGERTVITMDLDLYERAYLLIHSRDDLRDKFVLRLGELHVIFAQLRAIWHLHSSVWYRKILARGGLHWIWHTGSNSEL